MFDWKVKAVAIQLRPTTNWPNPNAHPVRSARGIERDRQINSHSSANATGSSGHHSVGAKARADPAPASKARRNSFMQLVIARSAASKQSSSDELDCFATLPMTPISPFHFAFTVD